MRNLVRTPLFLNCFVWWSFWDSLGAVPFFNVFVGGNNGDDTGAFFNRRFLLDERAGVSRNLVKADADDAPCILPLPLPPPRVVPVMLELDSSIV